jgi:hypothetical protein
MRRLSSGETDLSVPAAADRDEIGDMARSLEVFRGGEIADAIARYQRKNGNNTNGCSTWPSTCIRPQCPPVSHAGPGATR